MVVLLVTIKMSIEVFILGTGDDLKKSLRGLKVKSTPLGTPSVGVKSKSGLLSYRYLETLKKSNPKCYTLIVKSDSVTLVPAQTIRRILGEIVKETGWDVCYLCKWLDRCDLYKNAKDLGSGSLVKTLSPHGLQALVFSPQGKQRILGLEKLRTGGYFLSKGDLDSDLNRTISSGGLIALATTPNLFDYDVLLATKSSDLLKASECVRPTTNQTNLSSGPNDPGTHPFVWFIAVILIVILVLWSLYHLSVSRQKSTKHIDHS